MAKDPAFLFYPGDYLRDTQCLSEKAQVAYDRIMCEHMRNICISQQQLNFFTKRLSESEKEELEMILTKIEGGFQIEWVAISILNRRTYSESRRDNRMSKMKKDMSNISLSYDNHMENENENENKDITVKKKKRSKIPKVLFRIGSVEYQLSQLLFEKIKARNPGHLQPDLQSWAKHIGIMIRKDKRAQEEIKQVIEWSQSDNFWQNNILSTSKLREKYDQLNLLRKNNGAIKNGTSKGSVKSRTDYRYDPNKKEQRLKEIDQLLSGANKCP